MKKILKGFTFTMITTQRHLLWKAVNILRREILSWKSLPFNGQFQPDCQRMSLPTNLKLFVTNLLYGPSERVQDDAKEQASLSIAQLVHFQTRR